MSDTNQSQSQAQDTEVEKKRKHFLVYTAITLKAFVSFVISKYKQALAKW